MKYFVEVGSSNFETCLKLAENGWAGIVCEPHPELYNEVRELYSPFNFVRVQNCAISVATRKMMFAPTNVKTGWKAGISHLVDEVHTGTRLSSIPENQEFYDDPIEVQSFSLSDFIKFHNIHTIDYLKLDTEGHEWDILNAYDWYVKPTMIKLEHWHINDIAMKERLEEHGYIVNTEHRDMYAIR